LQTGGVCKIGAAGGEERQDPLEELRRKRHCKVGKEFREPRPHGRFIGFRFHDLRHQAITELAESGASDATMMVLAVHMSPRMLEHYSHVRMGAKRTALDRLESGLMGPKPTETERGSEAVQ
jgi:integrase